MMNKGAALFAGALFTDSQKRAVNCPAVFADGMLFVPVRLTKYFVRQGSADLGDAYKRLSSIRAAHWT